MTKKSPILAVNEPVKKTTRKRPAPRKATGSKKTASGKTSGRNSKGKKTIRRWQMPSWFTISLFVRTPTAGNPAMA